MEFLKEIFGEEPLTFEQLSEKLKDRTDIAVVNAADGAYVPKSELEAVNEQLTEVRNTAQADAEKYKDFDAQLQAAKDEGINALNAYKRDVAISQALSAANAADEVSVRANLNLDGVSFGEDGNNTMPLFEEYYADVSEKLHKNGCECSFSDEDFYLYILCHTYKHYIHGGTGLRSLLDVYVFLRSHPDLDRGNLSAELLKLKITDFEEKLRSLSKKVFTGGALSEQDKKDLEYLIMSGYKGTYENQEYHRWEKNLGGDDSKESKRRFLKSRIFISGEALEKNYPFVAKHMALYPLLLVWRPIKGALTHPKGILTEYKKVKQFKRKEE